MTMINSNPILSNDNAKEWTLDAIEAIYNQAFNDLLFNAHSVHRANFDVNEVQVSSLLSIKTGACPEDCGYCSQSAKHSTELERESLLSLDEVVSAAEQAKQNGSSRFCMGAAWRNPTDKSLDKVIDMIKAVKGLGMESCVTLGMLSASQVDKLKEAGLDYYNHNLDTSPEYYPEVISTRSFQDRLDTLDNVRNAGINVCSGGIVGMGETIKDRLRLLQELANLPEAPQSVPINHLVPVQGTPLQNAEAVDPLDFVRVIATARILMPTAYVRLSAGRESMSEAIQAMCFFAGANSMFYGEQLLTTDNNPQVKDDELFVKLGINKQKMSMGQPVSV